MRKQNKALADFISTLLGNVAVVGIGLAIFEQKWDTFFVALIAAIAGGFVAWRSNHD